MYTNKGFYNVKSNETLCSYEFGNVDKVSYTSINLVFIHLVINYIFLILLMENYLDIT